MNSPTAPTSERVRVVRRSDLTPTWNTPGADREGSRRWLITYVGGPPGFINTNPGVAIENDRLIVGYMGLGAGQRQLGFHRHSVTEIYVVVTGELVSMDQSGDERASPMDCLYIPAGVDHAVRNSGTTEAGVLYIHDALERKGTSTYSDEPRAGPENVRLVRAIDLNDNWASPKATTPPYLRSSLTWVGGVTDSGSSTSTRVVASRAISLGRLTILAGNRQPVHSSEAAVTYVLLEGECSLATDDDRMRLGPMDAAHVPAGTPHSLRALSVATTSLLFAVDRPVSDRSVA